MDIEGIMGVMLAIFLGVVTLGLIGMGIVGLVSFIRDYKNDRI